MEKELNALASAAETKVSRRALLRAGWIVPVVLAVGIPRASLAQTGSDAGGSDDI